MKSIAVPFRFTSDTKGVATTSDINKVLEQHIIDVLTTTPGERVMNTTYGANLRNLLFEEPDPLILAEYRMDAINDLNSKLPFGKVVDLQLSVPTEDFYGSESDTTIRVSVKYAVPPYEASVVTFNINNTNSFGDSFYA